MGVRKLNKFLTERNVINIYHNLQEFINNINPRNNSKTGKIVIAIDFWLYAHKFLHSRRADNILLGFWNQIMKLLSHGAIPLYVMDGSIPIEKFEKIDERNKKITNYKKRLEYIDEEIEKFININDLLHDDTTYDVSDIEISHHVTDHIDNINYRDLIDNTNHTDDIISIDSIDTNVDLNINVNVDVDAINEYDLEFLYEKREKIYKHVKRIKTQDMYNIYRLFDVLEIPYVRAEFEADALCAKLYKDNIITCCLSDDMDMLALGCGSTIKFHEGSLIEFNLDQIRSTLEFSQEQFIDMCIMFGCDYLRHPVRIGCDDAYSLIKKHGSLLDALCSNEHESFNMSNRNVQVIGDNYYQVKDIYLKSCDKETVSDYLTDIKMQKISFNNLTIFLKRLKWFDTSFKNLKTIEAHIVSINSKF